MELLLIEDDVAVASFIKEVMEVFFSATVFTAATPAQARKIWSQRKDSIAVILSDLVLPGEQGEHLVADLVSEDRDVPVIFITGQPRDAAHLSRIVRKPVTLVLKPFRPAALKAAVEYALQKIPAA